MDEREMQYEEKHSFQKNNKKVLWDMALGLQEISNLKPSIKLEKLIEENLANNLPLKMLTQELKQYYVEELKTDQLNPEELECDFVTIRIVELLKEDKFDLSVDYFKYVHKVLFQDVYDYAGLFRTTDITIPEDILNGESVCYGNFENLAASLEYDILLERKKDYAKMSIVEVINSLARFTSHIWQVYPFKNGNTRTVALFMIKYLTFLGFNIDMRIFNDNSLYFRQALVRGNYFNNELNIKQNNEYLIYFYENLLLGKNNNLLEEELILHDLF